LVASEREFQDEVWKKVEERTRLYTWRQGSAEPLTRVCISAVTLIPLIPLIFNTLSTNYIIFRTIIFVFNVRCNLGYLCILSICVVYSYRY